jgi:hypothetical protein
MSQESWFHQYRDSETEDWTFDEDPGEEEYQPATFDYVEFEAKKRRLVELSCLAIFGFLALVALLITPYVSTPLTVRVIIGVLGISAALVRAVLRRR